MSTILDDKKPKISIIIPTRRPDNLKECLSSITRHTKDYEVILVKEKCGIAEKLNKGIKRAKGDYIILLHDDIEVTSGWADELAEVGCFKIGEANDAYDTWGGFYPGMFCQDPTRNPDYCFFLCLSKKVANDVCPFDEEFTKPYFQDVVMGVQLRQKGYKIKCLPGKIIHRCGAGSGVPDERQKILLEKKYGL
jgi:glycosyltransferase involved in cell wall biosynthesis